MKSGLEGRNNLAGRFVDAESVHVSMKSGLEGRNNSSKMEQSKPQPHGLNEVRPRRPEQSRSSSGSPVAWIIVSMKSGLEGRNNGSEWLRL